MYFNPTYITLALSLLIIKTTSENITDVLEECPNDSIKATFYGELSPESVYRVLSNVFSMLKIALPFRDIYTAFYNKNECINRNLSQQVAASLDKIGEYIERGVEVEKLAVDEFFDALKAENLGKIQAMLDVLATQINDSKLDNSDKTLGYIADAVRSELNEMVEAINANIDEVIQAINENSPIDSAKIAKIITDGNNDLVNQIIATSPPKVQSKQKANGEPTAEDAAKTICDGLTYTNPETVATELDTEAQEYIKTIENELKQLLNDINSILDTTVKDITSLIDQIIDYQETSETETISKLKTDSLKNIKTALDKNKRIFSDKIAQFVTKNNEDLVKFMTMLSGGIKSWLEEIFRRCKKNEYLMIRDIINGRVERIVKVILEAALYIDDGIALNVDGS